MYKLSMIYCILCKNVIYNIQYIYIYILYIISIYIYIIKTTIIDIYIYILYILYIINIYIYIMFYMHIKYKI